MSEAGSETEARRIATEAREGLAAPNGVDLAVFDNEIRCQEIPAEDEPSR